MKTFRVCFWFFVLFVSYFALYNSIFTFVSALEAAPDIRKPEFFAGLEKGQPAMIKELPNGTYQINISDNSLPSAFTISEIGPDFLEVSSAGGRVITRIPKYSIRCIVVTKFMKD